jgi:hypothetical protein
MQKRTIKFQEAQVVERKSVLGGAPEIFEGGCRRDEYLRD